MVDLSSNREYADLAWLETVTSGDTVIVRHHTTAVTARVMGYTFDPLTGSYISLKLGQAAADQAAAALTEAHTELTRTANQVAAATTAITGLRTDLTALDTELDQTRTILDSATRTAADAKSAAVAAALRAGMLEPGNLVWNLRFAHNADGWGTPSEGTRTVHTSGGYRDAYITYRWATITGTGRDTITNGDNDPSKVISTASGRSYRLSVRIRCAQPLPAGALTMSMFGDSPAASAQIPANTWTLWEAVSTTCDTQPQQGLTWLTITGVTVPTGVDIDLCEPTVVEAAGDWLIIDGTIKTTKIIAGAITTAKLTAEAVDAIRIKTGTITALQIAAGTLTAAQIKTGSLTGDRLVANTITAVNIMAGSITSES
ncbi:hypothetical protein FYJ43_04550 [Cutibacterium sp. WCA-380-WT-3A]|uniref:DUF1983 domain-containing protein n=1 Tax=Cutibacterium porci TaxID=2605781 RepID=A0A7K0J6D7_9ACTN|nr:hypothetical protein [Cutibacterium porci]MSS45328.1 hypothetical protein [Cutibacterium porci]